MSTPNFLNALSRRQLIQLGLISGTGEEIYADVEDQLNERKVPEFKSSLIALQDEVKAGAKNAEKISTGYQSSLKSIDAAINALPESERQSPRFVLQVINGLLDTANSEYGAAIANNKISHTRLICGCDRFSPPKSPRMGDFEYDLSHSMFNSVSALCLDTPIACIWFKPLLTWPFCSPWEACTFNRCWVDHGFHGGKLQSKINPILPLLLLLLERSPF
ncbi:hypothetical protein NC980_10320 [Leptolyngbya sp. AS-A5]|nr:hypothetical protein [Leptolyngbya sp. FACHB-17]